MLQSIPSQFSWGIAVIAFPLGLGFGLGLGLGLVVVIVVVVSVSVSVEVVLTTASCAPPSSSLSESDLKESSIFIPRGDFSTVSQMRIKRGSCAEPSKNS